ncbi:hypothetical protein [Streptomyces verrucosisporus]|uniref:hypothetical protein n=1 Tax=Streptomyces verrucosisporus TaxID=1695161 RepID=UPI003557BF80
MTEALVGSRRFFTRAEVSGDRRALYRIGGRQADTFYRDRWSHDKVVRSTHGVNCTGSCSWKVYVKDGIITWERRSGGGERGVQDGPAGLGHRGAGGAERLARPPLGRVRRR